MGVDLAERLLLLAYDETGRPVGDRDAVDFGLSAAVLMELTLAGRLALVAGEVAVTDTTPTGDPVADEVLATICAAPRREPPQEWLQRLGGLRQRLLDRLAERGVLRRERDRVLLVFRRARYPSGTGTEPAAETDTRRRLREAVDGAGAVDARATALCALVLATGLEAAVFPGHPREHLRARLAAIAAETWADDAVRQAMRGLEQATVQSIATNTTVQLMMYGDG